MKPTLADKFRGRKRDTTWNIMAACDFDLKFTYMLSGWEGSAHDARVLSNATEPHNNFPFPPTGNVMILKRFVQFNYIKCDFNELFGLRR